MKYSKLGKTDIDVSKICLGTMTWGEQNTQDEAHAQLDFAISQGVNFIDTAEMYPVPPMKETYTRTEEIIGNWEYLHKNRDKIILASKIAGPSESMKYVRNGENRLNHKNIMVACENSLKRLRTDYIDLYQLHWPDRTTNFFGQRGFELNKNEDPISFEESLNALLILQKEGKIRHFGVSNETPWGLMSFLEKSNTQNLPRVASIQNPYNLLNRTFEIGLSEISIREKVGLLAYSPMAFGVLSGKYLDGKRPANARITRWDRFSRYQSEMAMHATTKYCQIAKDFNMSAAQMSLAFVNQQDFVTSNIIGATNLDQLRENIASINITLSNEILTAINEVQKIIPDPCP